MADEDEIAALVIDNGSGMCKGGFNQDLSTTMAIGGAVGSVGLVVDQVQRRRRG